MHETIDVQIGEVKSESRNVILHSRAIGSCIVIAAYDSAKRIGAMTHVMLPGRAPAKKASTETNRYASNAIDSMLNEMSQMGSTKDDIGVVLVGGGNVLDRQDDTICKDNIASVLEILKKKHLKIKAQALGGKKRRGISFDIGSGVVTYTEGDSGEVELWRASEQKVYKSL
jgi:chemotaxis protein CheD